MYSLRSLQKAPQQPRVRSPANAIGSAASPSTSTSTSASASPSACCRGLERRKRWIMLVGQRVRSFIHHQHREWPTKHVLFHQFRQRFVVQPMFLGRCQREYVASMNPAGAVALQEQPVARAHTLGADGGQ